MNFIPLPVQINSMLLQKPHLEIYYPAITGFSNRQIENKVNSAILKNINELISIQGYSETADMQMQGSYEIKTNERNILSLTLINDMYSGGAHSYTIIKPLTFDMKTGNLVAFEDLFKEGSLYTETLSAIVSKQIKERNIPLLGGFDRIPDNQEYYIADKSLVLLYQLYTLAPYAQGFLAFPISLYKIDHLIGSNSILKRMMTFY